MLMPMAVNLTPELEALVARKVADGVYSTEAEVIEAALRALEAVEDRERRLAALREKAEIGLADLEAGRVSELTADDLKRMARERYIR
jgi:putative addiction module CopG family antidote